MFISGVNDTGNKLLTPPTNLSTVSLTLAKNLSAVFGTDPDWNGALDKPLGVELIPAID